VTAETHRAEALAAIYRDLAQAETRVSLCLGGEGDRHELDRQMTLERVQRDIERALDRLHPLLPAFIEEK
jgi:hypothetical protein